MSILGRGWRAIGRFLTGRRRIATPAVDPTDIADVLAAFQREIGVAFNNLTLLTRALTHRSYLGGESEYLPASNERFEFLGDAVLELIVIDHLFREYPEDREGDLTQKKSLLVSKPVLADRAERMDLGRFVLMSGAERDSGGGERQSILADAFEAVLGAVYLDQGLDAACAFVNRWLLKDAGRILDDTEKQNFKSILQEQVQATLRVHPRYRIRSQEGPDHDRRFTVEVVIRGRVIGLGQGKNKKKAEQAAARNALGSRELSRWLKDAEE